LTSRGAVAAAMLTTGLLAAATMDQAAAHARKPTKPKRSCVTRHHHRVCTKVRAKPRQRHTTTSTTTSTSTTSSASSTTTTSTETASSTQTTASVSTTTTSTGTATLAHGTEVDELATGRPSPFYAMHANEPTLAAGTVHFNVYNYDQDPHTFAIADTNGNQLSATIQVPAGHTDTPVTVTANLPPGTYVLFCTLPQHAADGMQTTIVVK